VLGAPFANSAEALDEDNIRAMYNDLADAAQAKDVDGVLSHMRSDARVKISGAGLEGTLSMDIPMYRDRLMQSWAATTIYLVMIGIESIEVAADGQSAKVVNLTEEYYQLQDKSLQSKTLETATLRLVDGQPKISLIEGVIQP